MYAYAAAHAPDFGTAARTCIQLQRMIDTHGGMEIVLEEDLLKAADREVVVVGGTADEGEWSRTPDLGTATALLQRATRLVPELAGGHVVAHRVGLRPARPTVRLEAEGRVVHSYGHGGAGVTLSWGCADEVRDLVAELVG